MTHNYLDYIHKNLKQILLFLYIIQKYKSILQQATVPKEISTLFILDFLLDIFLNQSIIFFLQNLVGQALIYITRVDLYISY